VKSAVQWPSVKNSPPTEVHFSIFKTPPEITKLSPSCFPSIPFAYDKITRYFQTSSSDTGNIITSKRLQSRVSKLVYYV
jgi:hypothetical protein